jgi:hypothetical protein
MQDIMMVMLSMSTMMRTMVNMSVVTRMTMMMVRLTVLMIDDDDNDNEIDADGVGPWVQCLTCMFAPALHTRPQPHCSKHTPKGRA